MARAACACERLRDSANRGRTGEPVRQGHAVEQDAGGESAHQEILEARLPAQGVVPHERHEHVDADAHGFEPQVDGEQIVARRHHEHPEHREEQHGVEFAVVDLLHLGVLKHQQDGDGRAGQHAHLHEHAQVVDHVKAVERRSRALAPLPEGDERQDHDPHERHDAHARLVLYRHEQVEDQNRADENGQPYLGKRQGQGDVGNHHFQHQKNSIKSSEISVYFSSFVILPSAAFCGASATFTIFTTFFTLASILPRNGLG